MKSARPSVFVGSSTEGLPIAKAIQQLLDHTCDVVIWSQGFFGLGHGTLETLVTRADEFDFAILALTPDDLLTKRDAERAAARDNVIFELGLFMGRLGRERTFIVHDRTTPMHLPSDLAGVTAATFEPHRSGNMLAALGAACSSIESVIVRLGIRDATRLRNLDGAAQQVRSAGHLMQRLVQLLARSRRVELDIISTQFGPMINERHRQELRRDLDDLERVLAEELDAQLRDDPR